MNDRTSDPLDAQTEHRVILRRVDRMVRLARVSIVRSRAAVEESRKVLERLTLEPAMHPAFLRRLCERRKSR